MANPIKNIFILSGQSNMSGRGGVKNNLWDGVIPPESASDPTKILRLDANLRWEVATEPLHHDIDTNKNCGIGPGMAFANRIKESVGSGEIGLVPCAIGGTAIKEWARGEKLYEDMVKRAKSAVGGGGGSEIRAVVWYQGESDTVSQDQVDAYKESMERLICNLRQDLNLPQLPLIQVALASGVNGHYMLKIRDIQKSIDLRNVVCVDAQGLSRNEDQLHLTTGAQVQLGDMLGKAYLDHFHSR